MFLRVCQAERYSYSVLLDNMTKQNFYPLLKNEVGNTTVFLVGPEHGRSYLVGKTDDGRCIISKGNGLTYSTKRFYHTPEKPVIDVWGLLLKQDAVRDFTLGNEISALGIKTNRMEYVLQLSEVDGYSPILLQYDVECPYRLSDAAFMTREEIMLQVEGWSKFKIKHKEKYKVAAEVLIRNLRILHQNGILHNALTIQNYTWALELLDFELAFSPKHPYEQEDYNRHVPNLFSREIIHTYQIIIYIVAVLGETPDYHWIEDVFRREGFNL